MNGHTIVRMFRMVLGFGFCILVLSLLNCGGGGGGDDNDNGDTPQYQLTVTTVGQGSVTLVPPGGTYDENSLVALIANPDADWSFSTWSGAAAGSTATTAVLMDADKIVTATFVQNQAQDTEAPTWPAGSIAASADIGATFLTLTWDEAQDNLAVTNYRILKNELLMDTTAGNKTDVAVTGLSMDTAYTFRVEDGDAAGNWSAIGITHTATTAAALPLDPGGTAPDLNTSNGNPYDRCECFSIYRTGRHSKRGRTWNH